jgi:hypothetical protein
MRKRPWVKEAENKRLDVGGGGGGCDSDQPDDGVPDKRLRADVESERQEASASGDVGEKKTKRIEFWKCVVTENAKEKITETRRTRRAIPKLLAPDSLLHANTLLLTAASTQHDAELATFRIWDCLSLAPTKQWYKTPPSDVFAWASMVAACYTKAERKVAVGQYINVLLSVPCLRTVPESLLRIMDAYVGPTIDWHQVRDTIARKLDSEPCRLHELRDLWRGDYKLQQHKHKHQVLPLVGLRESHPLVAFGVAHCIALAPVAKELFQLICDALTTPLGQMRAITSLNGGTESIAGACVSDAERILIIKAVSILTWGQVESWKHSSTTVPQAMWHNQAFEDDRGDAYSDESEASDSEDEADARIERRYDRHREANSRLLTVWNYAPPTPSTVNDIIQAITTLCPSSHFRPFPTV